MGELVMWGRASPAQQVIKVTAMAAVLSRSFGHRGGLPDPSTLSLCPLVPSSRLLRPLRRDAVGARTPGAQV